MEVRPLRSAALSGLAAGAWWLIRHRSSPAVRAWRPGRGERYRDPAEADERIRAMGPLERPFALEGPVAAAACACMCEHRSTAQWLTVALEPRWPVPIARMGIRHTWPSYLGAMNGVIRRGGWESSLATLEAAGTPVVVAEGARDPVPVPGRAVAQAALHAKVDYVQHRTADHELPITDPEWCVRLARGAAPAFRRSGRDRAG